MHITCPHCGRPAATVTVDKPRPATRELDFAGGGRTDSAAVGVPVARPWLIVRERDDGAREQAWSAVVDEVGHADRGGHLVTQQGSEWQEVES